ncbi:hypothetical protein GH714_025865 [Hevea brasiliensis]|uniref:Pantoate--beta-alanine ligase n=1 Tax=Hevea brasiliensis TaxID=3981 RepID=A0A6A6K6R9_HEVBR|nr:hypothetical protein GH714_025865 [Hevea brasiliensis]
MEAKKQPLIITDKDRMRNWSRSVRSQGKTIALVPTMGYLHQGHISLVKEAHKHANLIVVSIYVNPGKGTGHETWVRVERLEKGLCGKSRPVFFRGVATIVTKLFNIVEPDFAVFGKKDYQQWRIIQRMVRDLDFSVRIIGSEVMRDSDGLAMSSCNVHLSPEEREKALSINRSLLKAKSCAEKGQINCIELRDLVILAINEAGGKIDYAEIVDQETLEAAEEIRSPVVFCVAAWFGKTRQVSMITITLSFRELNKNSPGYQAPQYVEQLKEQYQQQQQQQQQPRQLRGPYNAARDDSYGRGRGLGRGEGGTGVEVDTVMEIIKETIKIMVVIQIGVVVVDEAEVGVIVGLGMKEAQVEGAEAMAVVVEGWVVVQGVAAATRDK